MIGIDNALVKYSLCSIIYCAITWCRVYHASIDSWILSPFFILCTLDVKSKELFLFIILGQRDPREIITFTFSILSNQSDSLPAEILPALFKRSYLYGVVLGLEEEDHSDPSAIINSLTASVVCVEKIS